MKNRQLVMIPGPTPAVASIQTQMGRSTAAFGDPEFVKDFKGVIADLKEMWGTAGEVFVIAGSGTLSMEIAIANVTKKGDNVLIVSHGYFGDRFIGLCERKGLNVDVLSSEWGKIVPVAEIEKKLAEKNYQAITVTHVDTATGVCAPIEEISKVVAKHKDTIYIVDGVCATAAEPELVDEMGIDILFTASQKAFGVPPGLAIVWAGPKAMERRKSLGTIPEFYADFDRWLPIMQDPSKYFGTPAVNLIWALQESIRMIKEEGLENRYARHKRVAKAMQAALETLGLKVLADPDYRAVTLSNLVYPEGVDDVKFRNAMYDEGVVVAGGLGEYKGNTDTHELVAVIAAIERSLYKVAYKVDFGKAIGVLQKGLLE